MADGLPGGADYSPQRRRDAEKRLRKYLESAEVAESAEGSSFATLRLCGRLLFDFPAKAQRRKEKNTINFFSALSAPLREKVLV
jgi:hypothetical protein